MRIARLKRLMVLKKGVEGFWKMPLKVFKILLRGYSALFSLSKWLSI